MHRKIERIIEHLDSIGIDSRRAVSHILRQSGNSRVTNSANSGAQLLDLNTLEILDSEVEPSETEAITASQFLSEISEIETIYSLDMSHKTHSPESDNPETDRHFTKQQENIAEWYNVTNTEPSVHREDPRTIWYQQSGDPPCERPEGPTNYGDYSTYIDITRQHTATTTKPVSDDQTRLQELQHITPTGESYYVPMSQKVNSTVTNSPSEVSETMVEAAKRPLNWSNHFQENLEIKDAYDLHPEIHLEQGASYHSYEQLPEQKELHYTEKRYESLPQLGSQNPVYLATPQH